MVENIVQAIFISYILMQFVQALVKPLIDIINAALNGEGVKPKLIELWPMYVTVIIAGTLAYTTNVNILPIFPENLGKVLTCIGIGLGPSFLYDLQDKEPPSVIIEASAEGELPTVEYEDRFTGNCC